MKRTLSQLARRFYSQVGGSGPTAGVVSPIDDKFGRHHNYLRMSLTEKCNLRCQYCMPLNGVSLTQKEHLLNLEERKRLINIFYSLGVNKIRFTGGEPTVSKQLPDLIAHARSLQAMKLIAITTNGVMLSSQLGRLVSAGLNSVNISLDTLKEERFEAITRRDKKIFHSVMRSINEALGTGIKVKINCVLMRGVNDDEIMSFLNFSRDFGVDVRFIELMPFDDNEWTAKKLVSYFEVIKLIQDSGSPIVKLPPTDPNDTSKWYHIPGQDGRIGFITSMSNNFCSSCNRLRITADGKLKVCLFGDESSSLLQLMRDGLSDIEIIDKIAVAVKRKKRALGSDDGYQLSPQELSKQKNRPMILIGG